MNPVARPVSHQEAADFDEEGGFRNVGSDVHGDPVGEEIDQSSSGAAEMAQRFSASELGQRAMRADRIEREFDFLFYFEDVVLRGQIDLWFEEAGELIVVDYKTDRENHPKLTRCNCRFYALALQRYAGRVADRAILFYLRQDKAIEIPIDNEQVRSAVRAFLAAQDSLEYPLNAGERCLRCCFRERLRGNGSGGQLWACFFSSHLALQSASHSRVFYILRNCLRLACPCRLAASSCVVSTITKQFGHSVTWASRRCRISASRVGIEIIVQFLKELFTGCKHVLPFPLELTGQLLPQCQRARNSLLFTAGTEIPRVSAVSSVLSSSMSRNTKTVRKSGFKVSTACSRISCISSRE